MAHGSIELSGGPAEAPPRNQWWAAALILAVAVGLLIGARVLGAHLRDTPAPPATRQAAYAETSAVADAATFWVRAVAERQGLLAIGGGCLVMWEDPSQLVSPASVLADVDRAMGGVLVRATLNHVADRDGIHYVSFDGVLENGGPVNFTVRVIEEGGRWTACGLGGPDDDF